MKTRFPDRYAPDSDALLVGHEIDFEGDLRISAEDEDNSTTILIYLRRENVAALRDHLSKVLNGEGALKPFEDAPVVIDE